MWIAMGFIIVRTHCLVPALADTVEVITADGSPSIGRRGLAGIGVYCPSHYDRTVHHRDRHGHRDVDGADVPVRALRGGEAWAAGLF